MSTNFPPPNFIPVSSRVDGVEVFAPAPEQQVPQPQVMEFTCPQCGATTAFSAAEAGLTCAHCGFHESSQSDTVGKRAGENEFTVATMERSAQGWDTDRKDLECQNCGAHTSVPPEALTHTCPFCGSNKVIQRAASGDVLRPRFLIPFQVEPAASSKRVAEWLGSSWMTPTSLKETANPANFTGMYLPFWTFDAVTGAAWRAEVGHTETERYYDNGEWKTRTKTVWRWESGRVQLTIDDLLVAGAGRLSALLLGRVQDYDLSGLCPYEAKYLAGMQAQAYDIPLEKAWETGREQMREQTRQACLGQASTPQVRNFSMALDFSEESWRYILLPVYLATYRFDQKAYQVMVNGQTGKVAGQRPVDWNRVWLVVAALMAPGLVLGLIGLLTLLLGGIGTVIGGVGFLLLVIGLVISLVILHQAQGMDDA